MSSKKVTKAEANKAFKTIEKYVNQAYIDGQKKLLQAKKTMATKKSAHHVDSFIDNMMFLNTSLQEAENIAWKVQDMQDEVRDMVNAVHDYTYDVNHDIMLCKSK